MKTRRRGLLRRGLAFFIAMTMCLSMLQMPVFAAEENAPKESTVTEVSVEDSTSENRVSEGDSSEGSSSEKISSDEEDDKGANAKEEKTEEENSKEENNVSEGNGTEEKAPEKDDAAEEASDKDVSVEGSEDGENAADEKKDADNENTSGEISDKEETEDKLEGEDLAVNDSEENVSDKNELEGDNAGTETADKVSDEEKPAKEPGKEEINIGKTDENRPKEEIKTEKNVQGDTVNKAPSREKTSSRTPGRVKAFLDAVAAIPEITPDNAEEAAEYIYGEVSDAYEEILGTEDEEREDVQEAAAVMAKAMEEVDAALKKGYATVDELNDAFEAVGEVLESGDIQAGIDALDDYLDVYNRLSPEDQKVNAEALKAALAYQETLRQSLEGIGDSEIDTLAYAWRTVTLRPTTGLGITTKVSVNDTVKSYNGGYSYIVKQINTKNRERTEIILKVYANNNSSFFFPKASDLWNIPSNKEVDYVYWSANGSGKKTENGSGICSNGAEGDNVGLGVYYFKNKSCTHSYSLTKAPNCINDGQETCSKCGSTRTISALGHQFSSTWTDSCTSHIDANCTAHTQTCTRCNGSLSGGKKSQSHSYGDWRTITEARPGIAGEKKRICTVSGCGHYEIQPIAALPVTTDPGTKPGNFTVKKSCTGLKDGVTPPDVTLTYSATRTKDGVVVGNAETGSVTLSWNKSTKEYNTGTITPAVWDIPTSGVGALTESERLSYKNVIVITEKEEDAALEGYTWGFGPLYPADGKVNGNSVEFTLDGTTFTKNLLLKNTYTANVLPDDNLGIEVKKERTNSDNRGGSTNPFVIGDTVTWDIKIINLSQTSPRHVHLTESMDNVKLKLYDSILVYASNTKTTAEAIEVPASSTVTVKASHVITQEDYDKGTPAQTDPSRRQFTNTVTAETTETNPETNQPYTATGVSSSNNVKVEIPDSEKVTLTYMNGHELYAKETYNKSAQVNIKNDGPEPPEDKEFVGWNTKEDGTGEDWKGETKTLDKDTILYAIWKDKGSGSDPENKEIIYTVQWILREDGKADIIKKTIDRTGKEGDTVNVTEDDKKEAYEGYSFKEESSTLAGKLTTGLVLTLVYIKDGSNKPDPDPVNPSPTDPDTKSYKVTVHYVYTDGSTAAGDKVSSDLGEGDTYSITSPGINGYTPDQTVVSGTMGTADIEVTVTYTKNSSSGGGETPETPDPEKITATWLPGYGDNAPIQTEEYDKTTREIPSEDYPENPVRDGYTFDGWSRPVIDEEGNITITAQWKPVDSIPESHKVTVRYIYADGSKAADDAVRGNLAEGAVYSITSPSIGGYTPDQLVVNGTMGTEDIEVIVTYTQNSGGNSGSSGTSGGGGGSSSGGGGGGSTATNITGRVYGSTPDPEQAVTVPGDGVPLAEIPEGENTDIPDEDVPLAGVPLADIPDADVPLAGFTGLTGIPDDDVPLASVPKTGDSSGLWHMMALLSAFSLMAMSMMERRKRQEKEN